VKEITHYYWLADVRADMLLRRFLQVISTKRQLLKKRFNTAFCKNTGHGANAANKNMVTPPKLGGNPIP